jgi:hypothetical protein
MLDERQLGEYLDRKLLRGVDPSREQTARCER